MALLHAQIQSLFDQHGSDVLVAAQAEYDRRHNEVLRQAALKEARALVRRNKLKQQLMRFRDSQPGGRITPFPDCTEYVPLAIDKVVDWIMKEYPDGQTL